MCELPQINAANVTFMGVNKSSWAIVAENRTLPINRTTSVLPQNGQANAASDGLITGWKLAIARPNLENLRFWIESDIRLLRPKNFSEGAQGTVRPFGQGGKMLVRICFYPTPDNCSETFDIAHTDCCVPNVQRKSSAQEFSAKSSANVQHLRATPARQSMNPPASRQIPWLKPARCTQLNAATKLHEAQCPEPESALSQFQCGASLLRQTTYS